MAMPKEMNRNALAHIRSGQKISAFVGFEFRPEVVKASGASNPDNRIKRLELFSSRFFYFIKSSPLAHPD
jgi:hypothetical protein